MSGRLRILSEHPHLGKPNDIVDAFDGAQAYVDAGLAEWVTPPVTRSASVETTDQAPPPETTDTAQTRRRRGPGKQA